MSFEGSQFQPVYTLTLFREDGLGVSVEPPAFIDFSVNLTRVGQPNEAVIQVSNLSPEMEASLTSNEYGLVRLEAGYEFGNNKAIIFEGDIRRVRPPEFLGGDFITTIVAGEGELSWRRVTIENTFSAGTTFVQMAEFCIQHMPRITRGDLSGLDGREISAPYTVAGPLRTFFDDLSETSNSRWSIQRTSLDFVANDRAKNTFTVTKKSHQTGLISASLDEKALTARMALDPALKPNGVVEIESPRPGTTGFWRLNDILHLGTISPNGVRWESVISGQRVEGVERVTGQDERTQFAV